MLLYLLNGGIAKSFLVLISIDSSKFFFLYIRIYALFFIRSFSLLESSSEISFSPKASLGISSSLNSVTKISLNLYHFLSGPLIKS